MSDSIRVVCRLRPLNKIEIANKGEQCVSYTSKQITINVGDDNKYSFAFDKIFGPSTHQVEIYKEVAIPVIRSVIGGFNGTIFAYGQTGGGKTWTMQGPNHHDVQFRGLIPRTIEGLFGAIAQGDENVEFVIKCSYIEIYNQKLFDLLDPSKSRLEIKEDKHRGVFIQNCTEISVGSSEHMLKTMDSGSQNRKVAFTGMNERSSRSHSLFIIHVNQKHLKKDSTKQSKLYFVDLAGSEKVGKTGCQGVQLQEAKSINKSLSSLGNVINALTSDKKQHVPYRDSKLTRILQESLGGNSKTTLIINCSMCDYNDKQTLSTLRFGYRAKSIKNKAKVNQQRSAKELLILLDAANKTISQLKAQMGGKIPLICEEADNTDHEQSNAIIEQLKQKLEMTRMEQQQKDRQLKDMELRIKNILLQLSQTKQGYNIHLQGCDRIFKTLKSSLGKLNKYMSRVYIDLQYWINNLIVDGTEQNDQIKRNMNRTFQNIMEFTNYYDRQVKGLFASVDGDDDKVESCDHIPQRGQRSKKIKLTYSEPNLMDSHSSITEQLQMSCIVENKKNEMQQDSAAVNSDKVSQEESFSEIQTLLQSLQTKQSHKILIEEMSYNLKMLRKQNEELTLKNQKLIIENKVIAQRLQDKYEERMIDLEERVQEYRNIIKEKDNEITNYIKEIERERSMITNEKVISERLKKVIDSNGNMKTHYEMEERVRALGSQRQKLFNELYKVRNQLDEAEINIIEQEQHIESLKQVMKSLTTHPPQIEQPINQKQVERKYTNKIYGTDTPNVVVTLKGGANKTEAPTTRNKQSSLRRKVSHMNDRRQEERGNILPFIKGFFN